MIPLVYSRLHSFLLKPNLSLYMVILMMLLILQIEMLGDANVDHCIMAKSRELAVIKCSGSEVGEGEVNDDN